MLRESLAEPLPSLCRRLGADAEARRDIPMAKALETAQQEKAPLVGIEGLHVLKEPLKPLIARHAAAQGRRVRRDPTEALRILSAAGTESAPRTPGRTGEGFPEHVLRDAEEPAPRGAALRIETPEGRHGAAAHLLEDVLGIEARPDLRRDAKPDEGVEGGSDARPEISEAPGATLLRGAGEVPRGAIALRRRIDGFPTSGYHGGIVRAAPEAVHARGRSRSRTVLNPSTDPSTPSGEPEDVVLDFLAELAADRAAGRRVDLAEYLRRYPGAEEAVAREYLRATDVNEDGSAASGQRTLGGYELIAELGRGGQGVVYEARDPRLDRRVALKVLEHAGGLPADALARFQREARAASQLHHPGICTVHDTGREGGTAWIALRLVEGATLETRLAALPDHRLPPAEAALLVARAAEAVHAAHEAGVIHRDLKPANIMVTPGGDPVILDFGLARLDVPGAVTLTAPGDVFGTPAYMAPEQIEGPVHRVDRRADVWALGATLYRAVTGRLPFQGPTRSALLRAIRDEEPVAPGRLVSGLPRDLAVILATALEKDLARRYASADALAGDLRRFLDSRPILARKTGAAYRLRRFCRRNPAVAASLGVIFLLLLGGLGLTLRFLARESELRERAEARLREVTQMADARDFRILLETERQLPGTHPDQVDRLAAWIDTAERLLRNRSAHEAALRALRARRAGGAPPRYEDPRDEWFDGVLSELHENWNHLEKLVATLRLRLSRAATIYRRSVTDHHDAWTTCLEAIAAAPAFRGLCLEPITGLVPLGRNPESGLFEFWHVESGERPLRDEEAGRRVIRGDTGLVLALLPPGRFLMGAPQRSGVSEKDELPVHEVTLDAFLIATHETTQGQWERALALANPSFFRPGTRPGRHAGTPVDLSYPVDQVTWLECVRVAELYGLALPTEAQWEYACRAGTETVFHGGDGREALAGSANTYDVRVPTPGMPPGSGPYKGPLPVGSLDSNLFGLHDMHGNLWEWCRDVYVDYDVSLPRHGDGLREPPAGSAESRRVFRGGSWRFDCAQARSANRNSETPDRRIPEMGVRFACPLPRRDSGAESR